VCELCLEAMRPIEGGLCSICGERLVSPHAFAGACEVRCGLCRRMETPYARAVAYGSYEGGLRDLIHMLKYQQIRPAANVLGRMLGETVAGLEPSFQDAKVCLIPVPLHQSKLRHRGFNQAELISRMALRLLPSRDRYLLCSDGLERIRQTQSQTGLTRHQRRENMRGAFRMKHPEQISGCEVLLIDDVFTTGTTVSECARILRRAGAAKVWVATVARTLKAEAQHAQLEPAPDTDMTMAAHG